jgi:multiple sugar transport system permease protein
MGIIGSFQVFAASFVMTRGGPQNATLFMVLYIYESAFQYYRMGYAAVLAWLLFAIIVAVTVIQLRITNRWVYYEIT